MPQQLRLSSLDSAMDLDRADSPNVAELEVQGSMPRSSQPVAQYGRRMLASSQLDQGSCFGNPNSSGYGSHVPRSQASVRDGCKDFNANRPSALRINSYDCSLSDNTTDSTADSSFALLSHNTSPIRMPQSAGSSSGDSNANGSQGPQPGDPSVDVGGIGSSSNTNQAFAEQAEARTLSPRSHSHYVQSTQFPSTAFGSMPPVMMPASHYVSHMGYSSSMQMQPFAQGMQPVSMTNPSGNIFASTGPTPPGTASLPQLPQFYGPPAQYFDPGTATAILAPDGSTIPLVPVAQGGIPLNSPHQTQPSFPRAVTEELEDWPDTDTEELAKIKSRPSKSFAEEASKYVQLQFSMTQRHGQACNLCKVRKIKCDTNELGCTNCAKIQQPCQDLCRLSGKSVPRGYGKRLEDIVRQLSKSNKELKEKLKASGQSPKGVAKPGTQKSRLIKTINENRRTLEDFGFIINDLRSSATPQDENTWETLDEVARRLMELLAGGNRPPLSDVQVLKKKLTCCLVSLKSHDETLEDGTRFVDVIRSTFAKLFNSILNLPEKPRPWQIPPATVAITNEVLPDTTASRPPKESTPLDKGQRGNQDLGEID